jgi:hypothetical protein
MDRNKGAAAMKVRVVKFSVLLNVLALASLLLAQEQTSISQPHVMAMESSALATGPSAVIARLGSGSQTSPPKTSGEYHDSQYGVSLSVPSWWWFTTVIRWGDHENTLQFWEQGSQARVALYYKIFTTPQRLNPNEMEQLLLRQMTAKAKQRKREGLEDYHVRRNSYAQRMINGRPAISWVGDYTEHGKNMSEYLVRVRSEKVNALFFASMPTEELDNFREEFDNVVETLEIP